MQHLVVAMLQVEAFLRRLDTVVQRLRDDVPWAKYDRRSVALLLAQLTQFMEDALGINVRCMPHTIPSQEPMQEHTCDPACSMRYLTQEGDEVHMQHPDDTCGGWAQSLPPRPFPKIPAKLLRDFSQYGSVFSIAAKCAEITRQRGLKKVDWQNPAKRKEVRARLSLCHLFVYCCMPGTWCAHARPCSTPGWCAKVQNIASKAT